MTTTTATTSREVYWESMQNARRFVAVKGGTIERRVDTNDDGTSYSYYVVVGAAL